MGRKSRMKITAQQKLEYVKLMVEEGYTNQQIQDLSGVSSSAISRWKRQYKNELLGRIPECSKALTPEQQKIQELEKQLKRAQRDNDILKKAAAFFAMDAQKLT